MVHLLIGLVVKFQLLSLFVSDGLEANFLGSFSSLLAQESSAKHNDRLVHHPIILCRQAGQNARTSDS